MSVNSENYIIFFSQIFLNFPTIVSSQKAGKIRSCCYKFSSAFCMVSNFDAAGKYDCKDKHNAAGKRKYNFR